MGTVSHDAKVSIYNMSSITASRMLTLLFLEIILGDGSIRCKFISGSIRNQNHFDRQFPVRV